MHEGMRRQKTEIEDIVNNPEAPNFHNTIAAYERSGSLLHRAETILSNLNSAETNDDLQALAQKMTPLLSEHESDIAQNKALFRRIKAVYEQRDQQ